MHTIEGNRRGPVRRWLTRCLSLGALTLASGALPPIPEFPLPVERQRSTAARQLAKPVLEARLLDDMETTDHWRLFGPGEMKLTNQRSRDGERSLRLTSATKTAEPPRVLGRPFAETGIRREFPGEDWTAFNRVSVWVYPDLPGFNTVSLLMKLQSEGTEGRSYTDGGLHFVLLRNREWNQLTWEIPHLERKKVRAVELIYRLQGNEPGATERVGFDFDHLELQRVAPDPFEGWTVAPQEMAFCHAGYAPEAPKVALMAVGSGTRFGVLDAMSGEEVWTGDAVASQTALGEFAVLNFSRFTQPGIYRLRVGSRVSAPFRVQADPWRESIIAGLNFFHCERCGFAIPGIHGVCHQDWRVERDGRTLVINGGWHDAGDLSQGLANTAEAVWAMLRLAESREKPDPELAERLRQEARWGADWLLKTRFGDGFRVTWATMDFWTDGVPGNADDVVVKAGDSPFENFLAASAEASAALAFRQIDAPFAARCQAAAEQDFRYAAGRVKSPGLEVAAAAAQAAMALHRLNRSDEFASNAISFAAIIIRCQETEMPKWDRPLRGFFYTSPQRETILHYNHRSHEQGPMVLADLCRRFPTDPRAAEWRACVKLYGEYVLKASEFTAPYNMIPAGVYRLDATADAAQRDQVLQGVRLAEGIYLRRFPLWGDFRGNLGVLLSQAAAAATAGRLLDDADLLRLARRQLEWTLGRNPFCQSLMYGVGFNYAPQYTAMSGDLTGSLPVGIQTRREKDIPYWPSSNCYNYAEVWVHPVSRWFGTLAELEQ